jgi:Dolichyl-phosphate-mannose-protein mannosyltransferase
VRRLIPFGVFAVLVAAAIGDHYFRDEFYYLACSRRLDWGYVDHPPLSIALLWVVRHVAGDSLIALRAAAAAAARRCGAGAFGETLAMTAAGLAPMLLALGSVYSMNVIDLLVWTLSARILIDVLETPSTGRWIALGVVLGLGLENKISVLWLGAGIAAGLILTPARRLLLTPGPWIASAIAAVLFAPTVVWQAVHGWPTLEFMQNASRDKMQVTAPLAFVADQILNMNPLLLPVWLGGLVFLLVTARGRALAIVFLTVAAILIVNRTSRAGYLAPAYPMLFGAGGAALERLIVRRPLRLALTALVVAAGAIPVPLAIPLLPVDRYVQYSRALGQAPSTEEKKDVGRLPQFFADRQGWERMVDQIAAAADRLSPAERASAAVLVGNYGEAGAIEQLGRDRGLRAISGHNNYWLWGPAGRSGDVLIVVSRSRERQEQRFLSVEQAGVIDCGDCMPYENGQFIFIGRGMKPPPLPERWPQFKHYE